MNGKKTIRLCLLTAALCLLLSGCFVKTVDELYALPVQSSEYQQLNDAVEILLQQEGLQYCAPTSGVNRQAVQLADLDGDGADEAVVLLKSSAGKDPLHPLRAYVFDRENHVLRCVGVICAAGTSFRSVEYAQLDQKPGLELLLGLQMEDRPYDVLGVYSMEDGALTERSSANYSEYALAELSGDGIFDLFSLYYDAQTRSGGAQLCRCMENGALILEPAAPLSNGVDGVKRIVIGDLQDGVPAVFAASLYGEDSILTDVFAFRGGSFQNITADGEEQSLQTLRSHAIYAADIDGDGEMELPQLVTLSDPGTGSEPQTIIRWYALNLEGNKTVKRSTYHCFPGGWYMELPDAWVDSLYISRGSEVGGVRGYEFAHRSSSGGAAGTVFTVYAFTGEDREQLAQAEGFFPLAQKDQTVYAAAFGEDEWAQRLTKDDLEQMFHFIQIDWNSGER